MTSYMRPLASCDSLCKTMAATQLQKGSCPRLSWANYATAQYFASRDSLHCAKLRVKFLRCTVLCKSRFPVLRNSFGIVIPCAVQYFASRDSLGCTILCEFDSLCCAILCELHSLSCAILCEL